MKNFIETPLYRILCTLFDLVILNLMYILCCLPVVTIGAAATALYGASLSLIQDEAHVYTRFVKAFLRSFKRSTVCWLLVLLIAAVACADFVIIASFWSFSGKYAALGLLILVLFLLMCTAGYLFPLLNAGRTIRQSIRAAFSLSMGHLPRTLLVCLVNGFPLLLLFFFTYGFLILFWFFLVIGFSLSAYVNCLLLKKILFPLLPEEVENLW